MTPLEATATGATSAGGATGVGGDSLGRRLLDLRFVVLSGKGGVGRTTVAAALARAAQSAGKRVLVAQTDAAPRLGHMLGYTDAAAPIGPLVRPVEPGLDIVNMTPRESLHQYALQVLKYEAVYRALFENRAVRGFLSAVPGLDAYAMLGKAWWHTTETVTGPGPAGGGRRKYDLVILDGPASGHAITMLKIPGAILATMPAGPLAKDARALVTLLGDRSQSALVVVTRAEELPARETVELVSAARALSMSAGPGGPMSLSVGPVVVNALPSDDLLDPGISGVLDRLPRKTGDATLDQVLELAAARRAQARDARAVLSDLARAIDLPLIRLPALPHSTIGRDDIDRLARGLIAAPAVASAAVVTAAPALPAPPP